jgi:hypothetical protein
MTSNSRQNSADEKQYARFVEFSSRAAADRVREAVLALDRYLEVIR